MTTRFYYWICARDPDSGRPYLVFGSDKGEEDARQKGMELLGGLDFEIKRFPTRDLAAASAFLRGKRLEQTQSLRTAGRRIGHTKSLRRLRRKNTRRENGNIF